MKLMLISILIWIALKGCCKYVASSLTPAEAIAVKLNLHDNVPKKAIIIGGLYVLSCIETVISILVFIIRM